jgi:hypothetical protein
MSVKDAFFWNIIIRINHAQKIDSMTAEYTQAEIVSFQRKKAAIAIEKVIRRHWAPMQAMVRHPRATFLPRLRKRPSIPSDPPSEAGLPGASARVVRRHPGHGRMV